MEEKRTKSSLQKAVDYLYENKKIIKDKDIVDKTGYKKSTVSIYLKGTQKASPEFINRFEEVFNIKISDFEKEEFSNARSNDPETVYQLQERKNNIDRLIEIINKQADTIQSQQETIHLLTIKAGDATGRVAS